MAKQSNGYAERLGKQAKTRLQPIPEEKPSTENLREKHIGGYFSKDVYIQLKMLGIQTDKETREMLAEMLNTYFRLHNLPPIAE